jgi:hypothetical protein
MTDKLSEKHSGATTSFFTGFFGGALREQSRGICGWIAWLICYSVSRKIFRVREVFSAQAEACGYQCEIIFENHYILTASQPSGRDGTLGEIQVERPAGADGVQGVKIEPAFVYGPEPAGSFGFRVLSFEKKIAVGVCRFVVTPYRGPGTFFGNFIRLIICMIFLRYFFLRVCFFRFFPPISRLGG